MTTMDSEPLRVGRSYLTVVLGESALVTVRSLSPDGAVCQEHGHGLVLIGPEAPMLPAVAMHRKSVRVERVLPELAHAV